MYVYVNRSNGVWALA